MPRKSKPTSEPSPGRALARPGDPMITSNGVQIKADVPKHSVLHPPNSPTISPEQFRALKKRNIKDLPAPVGTMNGVGAVFMYTMLGVGDREIADALHVTVQEILAVREHTAYKESFEAVLGELINTNSELIQARLMAMSRSALSNVETLAEEAKKEEVKLRANQDILDRAGVTAKNAEQRGIHNVQNQLRIVLVDGEKSVDVSIGLGVNNHDPNLN